MTELRAAAERAIAAWRKHAHPSEAVDVAMAGLAAALAAEQPQPVAEVTDSMMGLKRIRWLSDEAVNRSPIGAKLYLAPPAAEPTDARDAARYRFVRTADHVAISPQAARDPVAYDAAIDAAIAAAKARQG